MDEIQQLAAQLKTNPDDSDAWQRLSQLVDEPKKIKDCLNQITRIRNKNVGFDEVIPCDKCSVWTELFSTEDSSIITAICPSCGTQKGLLNRQTIGGPATQLEAQQNNISDNSQKAPNRFYIAVIITSNLVTILGVLFLHWDIWSILFLYWFESLVIGFYAILKMAFSSVDQPLLHLYKLFIIPFFCAHYGIFCIGGGFFLFTFFMGMDGGIERFAPQGSGTLAITQVLTITAANLWNGRPPGIEWFAAGIFMSHGLSFVQNLLKKKDYGPAALMYLMIEPYTSIVPLGIAIVISTLPIMLFGSFFPLLIILIFIKTVIDVWLHIRPLQLRFDIKRPIYLQSRYYGNSEN